MRVDNYEMVVSLMAELKEIDKLLGKYNSNRIRINIWDDTISCSGETIEIIRCHKDSDHKRKDLGIEFLEACRVNLTYRRCQIIGELDSL